MIRIPSRALRLRLGRHGVVAIEYALLAPAFLMLVLGGMDAGRVMWTQITLDRAVQAAARCAVVNTDLCATPGQVQAYAAEQSWGMTVPTSAFSVDTQACGVQVTANLDFDFIVPFMDIRETPLQARACYPIPD